VKNKKATLKKAAEKLLAALEQCDEEMQEDFWALTRDTIRCFVDPSASAIHLIVDDDKGDIRIVPVNMEVEDVQDLIMWLGARIQEERRTDIATAAVTLKN